MSCTTKKREHSTPAASRSCTFRVHFKLQFILNLLNNIIFIHPLRKTTYFRNAGGKFNFIPSKKNSVFFWQFFFEAEGFFIHHPEHRSRNTKMTHPNTNTKMTHPILVIPKRSFLRTFSRLASVTHSYAKDYVTQESYSAKRSNFKTGPKKATVHSCVTYLKTISHYLNTFIFF